MKIIRTGNLTKICSRRNSFLALLLVLSACLLQIIPTNESIIATLTAKLVPLTNNTIWIRPAPNSGINREIALHLQAILEPKGATVYVTNKEKKADICLNILTGKDVHPECQGVNTYYHPQSKSGQELAIQIQQSVLSLEPKRERPARAGNFFILRNTKHPAVIIEIGYLSEQSGKHLAIAQAIARGVENYYSQSKHQDKPKPSLPKKVSLNRKNDACNLYFVKHDSKTGQDFLALEKHSFRAPVSTPTANLTSASAKANYALNLLTQGPTNSQLEPSLPKGTQVLWSKLKEDTLTINFNKAIVTKFKGSLQAENLCLLAITKSVCQFPPINKVQILIEGRRHPTLAGNIDLTNPISLDQLEAPAFAAIVIDDLGANYEGTQELFKLPYPLTLAIMPSLEASAKEAKTAYAKGHEVIIHMPMEAINAQPKWYGPAFISTNMQAKEIKQIIEAALDQMPQAKGLSNHMGSKATSHEETMKLLLKELKRQDLFVFDSRTTLDTVIPAIAQNLRLPYAERTVFLDNSGNLADIRQQLDLLGQKAKQQGYAIGIGHVGTYGANMAKALEEKLPQLEAQGIVIVPLSELLIRP